MKVTVHGMVCNFNPEGKKDKVGNPIPTIDLYSDGDLVTVRKVTASDKSIGTYVDILCDLDVGIYNDKVYKIFTACKEQ